MMPARKGLLHKALQACILIMPVLPYSSAMAAEEPELERLFNTPQRRAQLDELRRRNVPIQRPATTPVTQNIRLDGIVRRTNGPSTVWINGEPHFGAPSVNSTSAATARVRFGEGKTVELKVGEQGKLATDTSGKVSP